LNPADASETALSRLRPQWFRGSLIRTRVRQSARLWGFCGEWEHQPRPELARTVPPGYVVEVRLPLLSSTNVMHSDTVPVAMLSIDASAIPCGADVVLTPPSRLPRGNPRPRTRRSRSPTQRRTCSTASPNRRTCRSPRNTGNASSKFHRHRRCFYDGVLAVFCRPDVPAHIAGDAVGVPTVSEPEQPGCDSLPSVARN